ncbi:MAG: hypothetical protein HY758_03450 [Nitrospirae bacterium]|nr:hypothetical protein [Nitrospirota bacterium]
MNKIFSKRFLLWIFCPLVALILLLTLNESYYSDYQTDLLTGVYIQDGTSDLRAGIWSVPVVYDWDRDGKKDLLVGQRYDGGENMHYGRVNFFKNVGTDRSPFFSGRALIQSCSENCSSLIVTAAG